MFWSIFYIHLWIKLWVSCGTHPYITKISVCQDWLSAITVWVEPWAYYGLYRELCSSFNVTYSVYNLISHPFISIPSKYTVWFFSQAIQLQLPLNVIGSLISSTIWNLALSLAWWWWWQQWQCCLEWKEDHPPQLSSLYCCYKCPNYMWEKSQVQRYHMTKQNVGRETLNNF